MTGEYTSFKNDILAKNAHIEFLSSSTTFTPEQIGEDLKQTLPLTLDILQAFKPYNEARLRSFSAYESLNQLATIVIDVSLIIGEWFGVTESGPKFSILPKDFVSKVREYDDALMEHHRLIRNIMIEKWPQKEKALSSGRQTPAMDSSVLEPHPEQDRDEPDDFLKVIKNKARKGDKQAAKRARQAAKRARIDVTGEFVNNSSVHVSHILKEEDTEFDDKSYATFPVKAGMVGWIRSRYKRGPFWKDTGKLAPRDEATKPGNASKIEWRDITEPMYYYLPHHCHEEVVWFNDTGLLPTYVLRQIESNKIYSEKTDKASENGYTPEQFLKCTKDSSSAANSPEVMFFWAAIERLLIDAKLQNKVAFVDKWMCRLLSVPDCVTNRSCVVAELFYSHVRTAIRNGDSVNKVFNNFLSGNLANWKIGETKKDFLDRTKHAVSHYWGPYSTAYTAEWEKLPDATVAKRPKYDNILVRQRKRVQVLNTEVQTLSTKLHAAAGQVQEALRRKLSNAVNALARAEETLSWWEKARALPGRLTANIAAFYKAGIVYQRFNSEGEVVETIDREASVFRRWALHMRVLARWPFKESERLQSTDNNNVPVESITVTDRSWWKDTKQYFTSGFIPTPGISPIEDVPVPMVWRSLFNMAKGLSVAVADGIPYAIKKVGGLLNYTLASDDDKAEVDNLKAPDISPLWKGAAVMAGIELVGAAVAAVVGAPILAVGSAFGAIELGVWAGRLGINTVLRWLNVTKDTMATTTSESPDEIIISDNRTSATSSSEQKGPEPQVPSVPSI